MIRLHIGCFLLLAGIAVSVSCAGRHDPLRSALQSGDWAPLLRESRDQAAVAGFLRGHTLLAANKNNESSCAFFTAGQRNLDAYGDWTHELAGRYAGSAVAHYLRGDALARRGLWRDAIASFDRAVALDRSFAAAYVGRAAARASTGDWSQALNDLYGAVAAAPQLAEAQSSLGWVLLQGKQPAETATRYFDRALAISPGYLLAAAGKGFAEMAAGKADEGAKQVVEQMKKDKCIAPLLAPDALLAAAWVSPNGESGASEVPGNVVMRTSSTDDTVAGIARGDVDSIRRWERMPRDPAGDRKLSDALGKLQRTDPIRFEQVRNTVSGFANWVQPGSPARNLVDAADLAVAVGGPVASAMAGFAVGIRNPKAGAIVGGAVGGGAAVLKEQTGLWKNKTADDYDRWTHFTHAMDAIKPPVNTTSPAPRMAPLPGFPDHTPPPGGATTNLNAACRDSGTWTLKPVFGLVYPMM